jgi:hypothetical protein
MFADTNFSFADMAHRFGEIAAYFYLEQIERAAGLSPISMVGGDPETRLAQAFSIQDSRRIITKAVDLTLALSV